MKVKLSDIQTSDEMLELRPLNEFTVSRYRQHVRCGVEFPALVLDADGKYVVSGNHRLAAYRAEMPDESTVEVEYMKFASDADRIAFMAKENMAHGMPMDGITRRRVALRLASEGMAMSDIAELFNVPERTLEKWGDRVVTVIGKGCGRNGTMKPVKLGPEITQGERVEVEKYDQHIKRDMGSSVRHMATQITRWLQNGWVNMDDPRNVDALHGLRSQIDAAGV